MYILTKPGLGEAFQVRGVGNIRISPSDLHVVSLFRKFLFQRNEPDHIPSLNQRIG